MRQLLILILFSPLLSADVNYVIKTPKLHNQANTSENGKQNLLEAISLVYKTKIGKELKPHISELMQQNKIQLTHLQMGHYGESGEGCVIKDGQYYYEGLYISLNNSLSTSELASSLVHEASHYRMIKDLVNLGFYYPAEVSAFEVSAFATQYEFITELEHLKLADRDLMFTDDAQTVSKIMLNAYKLRKNWSQTGFMVVFNQLVDYGYPYKELTRAISQRPEKDCVGKVNPK